MNCIAIIISCYKSLAPHFFKESLQSIYSDTFKNKKVYLYCDGPLLDEHYKIIETYKSKGLLVFFSEENKGLATAMNFLLNEVLKFDFKYIARMDADDVVINNRFQKQFEFLEQHPDVDVVGGWCIEVDDDGVEVFKKVLPTNHEELKHKMIARSCVIHPSVMMRSEIFQKGVRYNVSLYNMQDYELWSRLFALKYKFANLPEFILKFRFDDNFISRRKGFGRFTQEIKLRYEHLNRNSLLTVQNLIVIFFSSSSRLLPNPILKLLYKKAR